jgi:hypothetical protein
MRTLLAGVLGLVVIASYAAAIDITACNQGVPVGEVGVLQNDLDCSAEPSSTDGVWVERSGTLDLNGHTIIGPPLPPLPFPPGESRAAVRCRLGARCAVVDSVIRCYPGHGHCTVTSSAGTGHVISDTGIASERHLLISHVSVTGRGYVVAASGTLRGTDVSVSGGGSLAGDKCFLQDVSVDGAEEFGMYAIRKLRGTNVTVTNCGYAGIYSRTIRLDGLTATGNGVSSHSEFLGGGVNGGVSTVSNSTVTGNVLNYPLGGGTYPADFNTTRSPKLRNVTCEHSAVLDGGPLPPSTWGVCSLD